MKPTSTFVLLASQECIQDYHNGELTNEKFEQYAETDGANVRAYSILTPLSDVLADVDGSPYATITEQEYIDYGGYMERTEATNEEKLVELILNLHTIHVAMLRERIVAMMEITKDAIEDGGEGFDTPFFRKEEWLTLHDKVQQYIGF